ncbi:hypothetical protein ACLIJS_07685 [Mammaliicoccus sciuri]|uniref:hypothetical protein n=1 Tax=Mammaliicoccus sciuri TaxID=1296 RepID=UPI000D1FD36E|nr:hypothetical protein [Mammaliicoccus sciuri]PTK10074.1 hypothetical protein BU001_05290 [Mammaliicoccus sciuri]
MKKLLVLLFSSLLVLGACGQKEESSSKDDTKETKEVKKDAKKEDKKESKDKEVSKKTEPKSEEQSTEEVATNEQQTTQEAAPTDEVTQEQQNEQTIQEQQENYGKPSGQYDTNGPTYKEDENGNWKEIPKQDTSQQPSSSDNPYMNLPNQEWRNNTGSGLSSGEIQLRNEIKKGTYEGDDGDLILEAIEYYEQQYGQ